MRKTWRMLLIALGTASVVAGGAFAALGAEAYTGQWCDEGTNGWWYKLSYEGDTFLANTWYWIEDEDGVIRCYCFDYDGWLITDTTIDGETVDADGRWVDSSGTVITRGADEVEYAHSTRFEGPASSGDSSAISAATVEGAASASGSSAATKIQHAGDIPTDTGSVDYQPSTVSGNVVTNSWAGYTMTLPVNPTNAIDGDGGDWYYTGSEQENIRAGFYRLDMFKAGNTDLATFASAVLTSEKILGGDAAVGASAETINGLSFIKVTKKKYHPLGTFYNYAYIRQIPGTNYAHVITFETIDGTDYSGCMSTYQPI